MFEHNDILQTSIVIVDTGCFVKNKGVKYTFLALDKRKIIILLSILNDNLNGNSKHSRFLIKKSLAFSN